MRPHSRTQRRAYARSLRQEVTAQHYPQGRAALAEQHAELRDVCSLRAFTAANGKSSLRKAFAKPSSGAGKLEATLGKVEELAWALRPWGADAPRTRDVRRAAYMASDKRVAGPWMKNARVTGVAR